VSNKVETEIPYLGDQLKAPPTGLPGAVGWDESSSPTSRFGGTRRLVPPYEIGYLSHLRRPSTGFSSEGAILKPPRMPEPARPAKCSSPHYPP